MLAIKHNVFVWVIDDKQQVSYRKVELGERINGLRVIRAGLNANEWLVYEGLPSLSLDLPSMPNGYLLVSNSKPSWINSVIFLSINLFLRRSYRY
ncbi:hypothetical protein [Methylocucumis oryzae]|uniref:hypothetical protein n=1 Tax=Methylocucumis oryzae TaxID=1632867 RepID=UPI001EF9F58A|nr:hypothetical protein [Methylocucumis oryzae]